MANADRPVDTSMLLLYFFLFLLLLLVADHLRGRPLEGVAVVMAASWVFGVAASSSNNNLWLSLVWLRRPVALALEGEELYQMRNTFVLMEKETAIFFIFQGEASFFLSNLNLFKIFG